MAAGVRCADIILYNIIKVKRFTKCFFGHGSGRGVSSSPAVRAGWPGRGAGVPGAGLAAGARAPVAAGVLTRTGEGGRARGARGEGACCVGVRVCRVRYPAGVWACGRVVFLGAVGDAWCFLRGDGVASVVVVVWCRVVYPPNKTCNAKTSYKYAILVLACKSLCGA